MASQDWFEKDFYSILGVAPDADDATIKKTYRKLARTYHPDAKPGDTTAEQRFKEIGEAYAVLADPEERRQYDAVRAMSGGGARFTAGGGAGPGAAGFEDVFSGVFTGSGYAGGYSGGRGGFAGASGAAPDIDDIIQMFGQGGYVGTPGSGSRAGHGTRAPRRGRDIHASASLTFRQAVGGDTVIVNGVGGRRITARIPAGVKDGATIRLRGKGEPAAMGGEPGDLMLKIAVKPHDLFRRDGDNLIIDTPVTFAEAALGATISVPTLAGAPVKLRLPAGTGSGKTLRVKGKGVPRPNGDPGDLLVKVQITVPQRLDDTGRAAVETLHKIDAGHDPRADIFHRAQLD